MEYDEYIKETDQRVPVVVPRKALFLRDHAARWFRHGRQQEQVTWIQMIANVIVLGNS